MTDEAEFDRFWHEYPKKRSKGDALKAWKTVREKRPALAMLLKALAVMKASEDWRRDSGQYIPYAASWLRAWGWHDVPEVDLKDVLANGKLWWEIPSGVQAKARELGITEWTGYLDGVLETWKQYAARVRAIAESNKVVPIKSAA